MRLTLESRPFDLIPTLHGLLRLPGQLHAARFADASAVPAPREAPFTPGLHATTRQAGKVYRREQRLAQCGNPPLRFGDSSRGFQAAAHFSPRLSENRQPGRPLLTVRMHTSPGKRLTSAIGAAFSVATLTAFAVAPLTEEPPPHARIIEPVTLKPEAIPTPGSGTFLRQVKIARGETLASLMRKFGQQDPGLAELTDFIRRNPVARKMQTLVPGRSVHAELDSNNRIQKISYPLPAAKAGKTPQRLQLSLKHGKWTAHVEDYPLERRLVTRSAKVATTLFAATDAAGIPSSVTARIADIFSSDIDFHRDVRKGDLLRLVYEMFVDPESVSDGQPGRILAIEYLSGDKRLDALWFERADGSGDYYSFDGQAMKRRFLRSPLEYTRISSGFSLGRRHPVFRDWRVHKGVDYAAPTGTKIRTVGDGIVEYIGNQRGYGKVIIIKHDDTQSTLYAHMNRFASKLRLGDTVKQGQVIGEVGQTGWATGPHLHFEFQVNGKQIDPTTMLPQPVQPLDAESQHKLRASADKLLDLMRWNEAVNVAAFE